jgi:hypothetical protein
MTDVESALFDFLHSQPALYALAGERLWAQSNTPPPDYKPSDGAGIAFRARGGAPAYVDVLLHPSFQFKVYGATEETANDAYLALFDALHNGAEGLVRWAQCDVLGQTLHEPETGWPFVLAFFQVWIANQ